MGIGQLLFGCAWCSYVISLCRCQQWAVVCFHCATMQWH